MELKHTKTFPYGKFAFIGAVFNKVRTHTVTWNEPKNDIGTIVLNNNGGTITIQAPENASGEFLVSMDDKGLEFFTRLEKIELMDIAQSDLDATVFKGLTVSNIKNGERSHMMISTRTRVHLRTKSLVC